MPLDDLEAKIKAVMARSASLTRSSISTDEPLEIAPEPEEEAPAAPPAQAPAPPAPRTEAPPPPPPAASAPAAPPPAPEPEPKPKPAKAAPTPPKARAPSPRPQSARAPPQTKARAPSPRPQSARKAPARSASPGGATPRRGPPAASSTPARRTSDAAAASRLYERAAEMRGRLEKRRAEVPGDCTFRPKIGVNGARPVAAEAADATRERLYGDAARRRDARARAAAAKTRLEKAGHAPQITPRGRRSSTADGAATRGEQQQARADALYAHAGALADRLEAQRAAEHERPSGCTFAPALPSQGHRRARSASPGGAKAHDRLHAAAAASRENKVRQREARLQQEVDACSFTPKISRRGRGRSESATRLRERSPSAARGAEAVAQRSAAFERDRLDKLRCKREAKEASLKRDAPFRPRITRRGRDSEGCESVDHGRDPDDSAFDRLAGTSTASKQAAAREAALQAEMARYSFAPAIPRRATPRRDSSPAPCHERLYEEGRAKEAKERDLREAYRDLELSQCSFEPALPRRAREQAPSEARVLDDRREVRKMQEELKTARELEGCTFAPAVGREPAISDPRPAHLRLVAGDPVVAAQERALLAAERELEGCTFRPEIGRPPADDDATSVAGSVASSRGGDVLARMDREVARRREASVERRRRARAEDLAERREKAVPVAEKLDPRRLDELSKPPRGVNPARLAAEKRVREERDKRPRAVGGSAPTFGAGGSNSRSASPARSARGASPARAPSPTPRRAPSPAPGRGATPPPPPPTRGRDATPKGAGRAARGRDSPSRPLGRSNGSNGAAAKPRAEPAKSPAPPANNGENAAAADEPAPEHLSEFERWQAEMEAKLAAL